MENDSRPRMSDVARALGVSQATVSNAFRHPDQLSAALRAQVLETARQLGYPGPDPLASRLRRGSSTGAIGLILDKALRYVFEDTAAQLTMVGVATACGEFGMSLVLVPGAAPGQPDTVGTALVDGFVAFSDPLEPERVEALQNRNLPAVGLDAPIGGGGAWVGIDDRAGACQAARAVVARGHTRVGIITFPLLADGATGEVGHGFPTRVDFRASRARLSGYRRGLGAAVARETLVVAAAGITEVDGKAAAAALLNQPAPPTAILAMSDRLALGALAAATERGIAVPAHLSVVGFDDIPQASVAAPPLTTVRQPHEEKGITAVRMLLTGREAAGTLLPVTLVDRQSLAAPGR